MSLLLSIVLLAICSGVDLLGGCSRSEDYTSNIPPPTRTGRPRGMAAAPEADFVQGCSGCHGMKGKGGIGPKLAGRKLPLAKVTAMIRDGKGKKMPSYKFRYLPARISALAEYVHNL